MRSIQNNTTVMAYDNAIARAFHSYSKISNRSAFDGSLNPITRDSVDGVLLDLDMAYEMSKQPIRVLNPDGISDPFIDDTNRGVVARDLITGQFEYTKKVVGDGFTFTQNDQIIEALLNLQRTGLINLNLGGQFDNHTKCFVHATVGDEYMISNDAHWRGLLFKWGHDGSASLSCRAGTTRLGCLNEVPCFGQAWFSIKHTKSAEVKMAALEGMVVEAIAGLDEYDKVMARLMDMKIDDNQFIEFNNALHPIPKVIGRTPQYALTPGQKRSVTMVLNKRAAVRDVYFGSPTQENLYGTAAGAFHAAVEAFDHRFSGNRGARILAGTDTEYKRNAQALALSLI